MKTENALKIENIIKQPDAGDFMGIKIEDGIPKLYVPLTFRIAEDEKQRSRDILLFLRSISLGFKDKEYINQFGLSSNDQWPIDSYLWLIKDYLEFGLFQNREKTYKEGNYGRINWKRTIRKTPIISNGNIIYTNIITEKNSATDDLLSYTYKYCLNISAERVGWLLSFTGSFHLENAFSINEMVSAVRKASSVTFDDLKRSRLHHMLLILSNARESSQHSKEQTYGIRNYYYVFERMVDSYFGGIDQKRIRDYYPHGQWNLYPNLDIAVDSSELRPDTIRRGNKDEKYTYIIDAKMYKYGGLEQLKYSTEGLPETTSIQKQITYGEYVQNYVETSRVVRNMFILPFDKSIDRLSKEKGNVRYINENIAFIGFAKGDWRFVNKTGLNELLIWSITVYFV